MKKLLFLSVVLLVLCNCSHDEMLKPDQPDEGNPAFVPHFYGLASLENPAPETRGVANTLKIWSKPMAEENLTVKFLNGTERYREFIEEVVKEWEKYMFKRMGEVCKNQMIVNSYGSLDSDSSKKAYKFYYNDSSNMIAAVHRYLDEGAAYDVCHGPVDLAAADAIKEIKEMYLKCYYGK